MGRNINVVHKSVGEGREPVATELIAESIVEIGKGMKAIRESRLNSEALVVLLKDATKISARQIKAVLNALDHLEEFYLKKKRGSDA